MTVQLDLVEVPGCPSYCAGICEESDGKKCTFFDNCLIKKQIRKTLSETNELLAKYNPTLIMM